jgi:cell division protein FtsQ
LEAAVKAYPIVRRVRVETDFPHGARIIVSKYVPVAAVLSGATRIPVAPDGTLLRNTPAVQVPVIPTVRAPAGDRLSNRRALEAVKALALAPAVLLPRLARAYVGQEGLTAVFRDGPAIYFGDDGRLIAKWAAAVRVLADTTSAGAAYVDVRVPERPAAGGLEGVDTAAAPEPAPPAPTPPPAPVAPPPAAAPAAGQGQPST